MPSNRDYKPSKLDQSINSSVINNISTIPIDTTNKNNISATFLNSLTFDFFPTATTTTTSTSTRKPMSKTSVKDAVAAHVIETKVQEMESERRKLSLECDTLRSENKWYRKKLTETEHSLKTTEEKFETIKKSFDEQQVILSSLEKTLCDTKKKEKKRQQKQEQKKLLLQQTSDEVITLREKLERKETRAKALEIEAEYLQKQLGEIRDKNLDDKLRQYESDLYNERLEKDMAQDRVKTLEKEKEKVEHELFELKIRVEKSYGDLEFCKKRETDHNSQINILTVENSSFKEKISFLEQKLLKYKRNAKQQSQTIEKLQQKQKDPLSFNAWVQTEESFPSFEHLKTRDETITSLNSELDSLEDKNRQLRAQLEYYASHAHNHSEYNEELLRENQNLKNILSEMNRGRAKDEQRVRMLERELEIRDVEIEKRNKFIRKMNESSMHYVRNEYD
ncbi:predicted protein [Naegleria gruberi]|uniref:Predicted protein n=1 Tax=Naegleria gruberi TaxID=5762 RepID=D2VY44_NAEGR|nr:uncharacterized protein NAEGRDRAFT_53170 [Naegleria gruberi]EFC38259.1 predicted protein [Naegleria gruberi]|eukprot:XP_002671003.1 predicted protein [Naegleria gruberi strain NEG-M]